MTGSLYYLLFNGCGSVSGFISSPYTTWFPVVMAAALLVTGVIGAIFALAPLAGRSDLRTWCRIKFFDTIFSIVLIVAFAALATTICTINPEPILQNVGLVSNVYGTGGTVLGPVNQCTSQNTFNGLALCDISEVTDSAQDINNAIFGLTLAFSITPSATFKIGASPNVGIEFGGISLSPLSIENFASLAINATYALILLNYVQTFLLAVAPLIFAVFMAIGLIARVFGVTRSFGGAMIAFAIGIGIIYPLLAVTTYGFIDYTIAQTRTVFDNTIYGTGFFGSVVVLFLDFIFQPLPSVFGQMPWLTDFVLFIGSVYVALTFIAFLNLMILDAFIVDFSQAIGERMDFLSLLGSVI